MTAASAARFVAPASRQARDADAVAKLQRRAPLAAPAADGAARPSKLRRVPRPDLARIDRESYAGGAAGAVFLGPGRLVIGFQNVTEVWDLTAAKEIAPIRVTSYRLARRPGTEQVLSGDGSVLRLIDCAKRAVVAGWSPHEDGCYSVAVSPSGKQAASGGEKGEVRIWNLTGRLPAAAKSAFQFKKGVPAAELRGHEGIVSVCCWSPDGTRLLTAGWDDTVRLWDVERRKQVACARIPGRPYCAVFSPDGSEALVGLDGGTVVVVDARGGITRRWRAHKGRVAGLARADGGLLVSSGGDGVRIWDERGKPLATEAMPNGAGEVAVEGRVVVTVRPLAVHEMR